MLLESEPDALLLLEEAEVEESWELLEDESSESLLLEAEEAARALQQRACGL